VNLICPNCGKIGDQQMYHQLGEKKMLCVQCRAVLRIALICPACDSIVEVPKTCFPAMNLINKAIHGMFRLERKEFTCPVCDYTAEKTLFHKVAVYEDEYSVIF
jgi:RNA polymerase subunit RPABC4/transcription elongation factor Spt4